MTLEQQAWKERGGFGAGPKAEKNPTAFDWIARAAATAILLGFLSVSVWAVTLVPFGGYLLGGILTLLYVHLFFKVRELSREVQALRAAVEAPPRDAPGP